MSLIDTLPGISLPVAEVEKTLAQMWRADADTDHPIPDAAPSEFRAVQLNLIVHFGLKTTPEEARAIFGRAIEFAQGYPSRIIVLCPEQAEEGGEQFLTGKLFVQCYTGPQLREMCCCEALMLGYPVGRAGFLESQVSVWLETDLPVFHWFHRVPAKRVQETYFPFLKEVTRVLYDSSVEGEDFRALGWPRKGLGVDLAHARTLPVRQSLGQFLSAYSPRELVQGLQQVVVRAEAGVCGEGAHLLEWMQSALRDCAKETGSELEATFELEPVERMDEVKLSAQWTYADERFLRWKVDEDSRMASIEACLSGETLSYPLVSRRMPLHQALGEAMFFS